MSKFSVIVVEYPEKHLVGMTVRTSMDKAPVDIPPLWEAFDPHMGEFLKPGEGCKGSYGVSVMLDGEAFDYYAAVEAEASAPLPADMAAFTIPAGLYATCDVPSLEVLGDAYMHLYTEWLKDQTGYTLDEQGPCFEQYPPNYRLSDTFAVFMPVRKV